MQYLEIMVLLQSLRPLNTLERGTAMAHDQLLRNAAKDRLSEAWKDEFLERDFISGFEILQLSQDKREWLYKYPEVFSPDPTKDGLVNKLKISNDKKRK